MMTETITLPSHTITIKKNHTQLENWSQKETFREISRGFFLEMVTAISIPICFWGLVGNATVLWLLCSKVKKTTFMVYALNLVMAEFIVAAYFFIVFSLFLSTFHVNLYFSRAMENIYSFAYSANIHLLTVMCVERYCMVFFPDYYQHHRPKDLTKNMCFIIWFWTCLMALVMYVACYPRFLSSLYPSNPYCEATILFETIVYLMFLFPIMSFSALSLFIRMRRRAKQSPQLRIDVTITILVAISLIFVFTLRIVDFLARWDKTLSGPITYQLSLLFDSIKSSITPLVYFFVGNRQRQRTTEPMYVLLERALQHKESPDAARTSKLNLDTNELGPQK